MTSSDRRTASDAEADAPSPDGPPLLDDEIRPLRTWRRAMRVGCVAALALLAVWVGVSASVEDSPGMQVLGGVFGLGLVAWGLVVQFGGRCPRCSRRLTPTPPLRIPARCPRCGTDFGRAA